MTREMAEAECEYCGHPIDYGNPFYMLDTVMPGRFAHAHCEWEVNGR